MRGVVFTGGRGIELMEFPDPTPGPGEVVVEMKASGMCGSDLHQYRRPKSGGEAIGGLPAFTAGAAVSCGTGAAYGALRRLKISGDDTIALFGQGPVGLSATQLASAMGARVIALDTLERGLTV